MSLTAGAKSNTWAKWIKRCIFGIVDGFQFIFIWWIGFLSIFICFINALIDEWKNKQYTLHITHHIRTPIIQRMLIASAYVFSFFSYKKSKKVKWIDYHLCMIVVVFSFFFLFFRNKMTTTSQIERFNSIEKKWNKRKKMWFWL